jgi:hypothetical protein
VVASESDAPIAVAPRRAAAPKQAPKPKGKAGMADEAEWNGPVPDFLRFST